MTATATGSIFVLDPTAPPRELRHTMAPRPQNLRGKSVGFLWNSKPNGDILFDRLEALLREKYEISNVVHQRKPSASIAAKQEVMDALTTSAHVAIVGLGD